MAYGLVISKRNGMFDTPNKGILVDLATGITYAFSRPDAAVGTVPTEWNVKVHDIVSFTLVGGVPMNVTLYKKHVEGTVFYKLVIVVSVADEITDTLFTEDSINFILTQDEVNYLKYK